MSQIFLFTSVIVSGILCIWGLFFSHRIAGPLYRLNKYFKDAKDNKGTPLDQIKFRKNDFFQEVPDSINEYFESDKSAASLPEVPVEKKAS